MRKGNITWIIVSIIMVIAITLGAACAPTPTPGATAPTVISTSPGNVQNIPSNATITATFSEAMDPATVNNSTFKLMQGSTPVPGTVTSSGNTATFVPGTGLQLCMTYTASITTGAKNAAGSALARDYVWNFYTSCATSGPGVGTTTPPSGGPVSSYTGGLPPGLNQPERTIPTVLSTNPTATCVAINSKITIVFSEKMKPSTINTNTFTLTLGAVPVLGTVAYSGVTATFTPVALVPNSLYTATITTGAQSLAGYALAAKKVWTFTTGPSAGPSVFFTIPATCVPANSAIVATFSQAMNQTTVTQAFTLRETLSGTVVPGAITYSGLTAIYKPASDLTVGLSYTAAISTVATDLCGNHLGRLTVFTFIPCAADLTQPSVTSTVPPLPGGVCVPVNSTITVTFDKEMNPSTVASAFTLMNGATNVPVTMTYAGNAAIFTPNALLSPNTTYNANVSIVATDLAGNVLLAAYPWSFTTCALAPTPVGPLPVELGLARNFALLSKTGITDIPSSVINGEVGTSPITGAAITGLTCAEVVTGQIHTVDAAGGPWACRVIDPAPLGVAVLNMETAYTDAAGRTPPTQTNFNAGNLGGQSLAPGLYKFTSGVTIPTNFTLTGGATDTYIFQIAGDLNVGANVQILTPNGVLPQNIFWQVGGLTGATLGTSSHMVGTILTAKQVIFNHLASLDGRALAQTQIVLDANTVTRP